MTSLAAPAHREWPTWLACAIGTAPALLFSAAWASIDYVGVIALFLMFAVAFVIPGWAAWVASKARSSIAVVGTAVAATMSYPAIQLIFIGGGRLGRALFYGWIGLAFLMGILVALWVMRRGGSIGLIAGWILGANAMALAMLPLLLLVMIPVY